MNIVDKRSSCNNSWFNYSFSLHMYQRKWRKQDLIIHVNFLCFRWNLAKPWLLRNRPETVISDPEVVATFIQPTCDFPPPGRRNFKIIHDSTKLYTNHHVNKKTQKIYGCDKKQKHKTLFSSSVPPPKKNCTINRNT